MCRAIRFIANNYNNVEFVYPVHLNPNVRDTVNRILRGISNVHLTEPLDYPYLIWLMNKSYMVLTDSGGLQEEALLYGKPVLVMRDVTEREEGIKVGAAKLVGTRMEKIINNIEMLLTSQKRYKKMAKSVNIYGDGTTSQKIYNIIKRSL